MNPASKYCALALLSVAPFCAQDSNSPKHLLGIAAPLTAPSAQAPRDIALAYIRSVAGGMAGIYLAKEYQTAHNGVTHLIYKQRYLDVEVANAEWVVNVDRDGQVLNAGGSLYESPGKVELPALNRSLTAVRSAAQAVNPRIGHRFTPFESSTPVNAGRANAIRFAKGGFADDIEGTLVWYGADGSLRPAWQFSILDDDGVNRYAVVVDDASQAILAKRSLTLFQAAPQAAPMTPRGLVFEGESPQPNPTQGIRLTGPPPIVPRTLQSFTGDPIASPRGWTAGTETSGNNAVVGENLLGIRFLTTPAITGAPNGDFSFPLQLGAGAPNPLTFRDAANTNLFYWMNRAHDLHYQSGFDEAAGNFQQDNFGRGGAGGDPIYAYSHFGATSVGRAQIENAFFSSNGITEDGSRAMVGMFLSNAVGSLGDFFTDGSYDSVVMVHEYTHGVSTRLVRRGYETFQGGAMGEAWSDFFGIEYTLPDGAPPDGIYPPAQYFDQSWGYGGTRTRPYSTNTDVNPLTYANLGHVIRQPEVHADGEIWFEAMWEMRANLIKQFGEKEGRRRVRQLVIDGMKLSIPAPSMVDMRDAILLADRVDFKGASQDQLWAAF
ncbi:MAG: extracellular metalloproteinase, partial [Acidobacteriota bacterium]|nr:extracellular metalloproteinase [Acidobacteriota bacterium]